MVQSKFLFPPCFFFFMWFIHLSKSYKYYEKRLVHTRTTALCFLVEPRPKFQHGLLPAHVDVKKFFFFLNHHFWDLLWIRGIPTAIPDLMKGLWGGTGQ